MVKIVKHSSKKNPGKIPIKTGTKRKAESKNKDAHPNVKTSVVDSYKSGLLEIDKQQNRYDKLFEQKLAEQYREFRNLKEHHMQTKRFFRIFIVLVVIVLIALLILSYG